MVHGVSGPGQTVYRRREDVASRVIDELAFIVTPPKNRLHNLNATATLLWELAAEGCTVDGAAKRMVAEFEVELETARRDIQACLNDMVERDLLVVETAG